MLGNAQPLVLSPQHRDRLESRIAERMFGTCEVLVAAKDLLRLPGVSRVEGGMVDYFHFLFDRHELVFSNDAVTESLYTGPEALKAVQPEQRAELFRLFPELMGTDHGLQRPARLIAGGRRLKRLVQRHLMHDRALVLRGATAVPG